MPHSAAPTVRSSKPAGVSNPVDSSSTPRDSNQGAAPKKKTQREWAPRFWTGMTFGAWWRLLRRNRFAVEWRFWHHALAITLFSLFHSVYGRWQWFWKGRHAARLTIEQEPLFIIGHWRAGTTWLHELLVLDERHTSPTTYECLVPGHFLMSEDFVHAGWLNFLLPARRPMDNMAAGWDRPQEDEFALANLGLPSPYLSIAFPNHPPQDREYLTLEGLPPAELARWKRVFLGFLQQITYRTPKRIVLKSPPHTCRIKTLLEIFPRARFVHIVRDPYVLFPSTINLWKTLYKRHGLQVPRYAGLAEHVFETFERMYERFEADRGLIAPDRFCELRYEDLAADPIGNVGTIYQKLGLGEFEAVLPALKAYVAQTEGYKTNRYDLSSAEQAQIARRWGGYASKYGYETIPLAGKQV